MCLNFKRNFEYKLHPTPYPQSVIEKMDKLFTECVSGVSPPIEFPILLSPTLDESVPALDDSVMSVPDADSFDGDTSNGDNSMKNSSMCDISGVEYLDDSDGQMSREGSVEVFLAKMMSDSKIVDVSTSTDDSVQIVYQGKTSNSVEPED